MDHFPGALIVQKAQAALQEGKQVIVFVQGISDPVTVESLGTDGPLAILSSTGGKWMVRLDTLLGLKIVTPYNLGALVG